MQSANQLPGQSSLNTTVFNASSVFSQSCALKQSTILSWHLPPVSLLLPPHHMGGELKKEVEVQFVQRVTTMVDVALLTLSHAVAPLKFKSQSETENS